MCIEFAPILWIKLSSEITCSEQQKLFGKWKRKSIKSLIVSTSGIARRGARESLQRHGPLQDFEFCKKFFSIQFHACWLTVFAHSTPPPPHPILHATTQPNSAQHQSSFLDDVTISKGPDFEISHIPYDSISNIFIEKCHPNNPTTLTLTCIDWSFSLRSKSLRVQN